MFDLNELDSLMTTFDCCKVLPRMRTHVPLGHFKAMEPLLFGSGLSSFGPNEDDTIFMDGRLCDLSERLDVAWLNQRNKGTPKDQIAMVDDMPCSFHRVRQVAPEAVRGQISQFFPTIIEIASGGMYDVERQFGAFRVLYGVGESGLIPISAWTVKNGRQILDGEKLKEASLFFQAAIGIAFNRHYLWRVVIGSEKVSISFVTNPTGSKEIFKLREIPEGKRRRESLQNWVSQHTRNVPSLDDPVEVRKHLRGSLKFDWLGYKVKIIPAKFDVQENERLRLEKQITKIRAENIALRAISLRHGQPLRKTDQAGPRN